jgi:hypothetical protein
VIHATAYRLRNSGYEAPDPPPPVGVMDARIFSLSDLSTVHDPPHIGQTRCRVLWIPNEPLANR